MVTFATVSVDLAGAAFPTSAGNSVFTSTIDLVVEAGAGGVLVAVEESNLSRSGVS